MLIAFLVDQATGRGPVIFSPEPNTTVRVPKGTYTATGPYRVGHVTLSSRAVYTNTTPGGAFRGFGVPQLAWAIESLIDEAARALDRDPVDLRRQNLLGQVMSDPEIAPVEIPDGALD